MAKTRVIDPAPKGPSKVRVVFIEMEAQDSTIQESIRALTAAIQGRPMSPAREALPAKLASGADQPQASEPDVGLNGETDVPLQDDSTEDESPKRPRRVSTPKAIDAKVPAGKLALPEYFAQYQADTQLEKCLVCVAWWRDELAVEDVGTGHLFTCFRLMKWTDGPRDYRTPLSDMAVKKSWLTKAGEGAWRLNHIGEAELHRLLAAKTGSK